MSEITFSILITTKNRLTDLALTLSKINYLLKEDSVECVIFDDGSIDGTYDFLEHNFPEITVHRNEVSKGYMFCRNQMLNETKAEYAISLDDDAHFLSENPIYKIEEFFNNNPKCGLIAFRLFWSKSNPSTIETLDITVRVKGFVGCGHVWRMTAWREIPNYPEWFVFYGEEDFAAYQLFQKNWEIHYLPQVLVQHRVDLKTRNKNADYAIRLRRSLRSGWYLYFMFYPWQLIPRKLAYTLWIQIKLKTFKGDWIASFGILQAIGDVILNLPRLMKQSNRLSLREFREFSKLPDVKLYWEPEDFKKSNK